METPKKNKSAMYQSTEEVLSRKDYAPTWQTVPGFVKLHTEFTDTVAAIARLGLKQGRRKTGVAEDKGAARRAMCKAAHKLAGAVAAYAHVAGNHELLTRVDTNLSILLGGRGKDSSDKCKDILAAATANLAALPEYNVQQAVLDALDGLIKAYDALEPKPQAARVSAKSAGQAQDLAFDKADGLLNNGLDKLMLQFEETHPDFYRDYTNARVIVDLPAGHNHPTPPTPPPPPPKT